MEQWIIANIPGAIVTGFLIRAYQLINKHVLTRMDELEKTVKHQGKIIRKMRQVHIERHEDDAILFIDESEDGK